MTETAYPLPKQSSVNYDDIDVDALLAQLTPEEIEELGLELIDPDVSHCPPVYTLLTTSLLVLPL